MFGGLANLEARFTMDGRTDSDRAVVTLDVEECDDRGSWGFRDQQPQPVIFYLRCAQIISQGGA